MKQSGGHARLDSVVDQGTRVELFLPRSHAAVIQEPARRSPSPLERVGQGEQVLIIEDDERLRGVIVDLLEQLGFRTLAADRGVAALEVLAREPGIALLLSDVVPPGGMTYPLLGGRVGGAHTNDRRRGGSPSAAAAPGPPHRLHVWLHRRRDRSRCRARRGVLLLEKPFTSEELAQALREALGKRPRRSPG